MRPVVHSLALAVLLVVGGAAPVLAQGTPSATPGIGLAPRTLTDEDLAKLEAYIAALLEKTGVPGASVAMVQDGQVIYQHGFGVREVGQPAPVTPETLMMIGSVTKPMTATMAASLVDDGRLRWETPVVDLLPGFAVADPAVTQAITVRDAFCACTGLPQRDAEFILNSDELTPEGMIASVAALPLAAPLGELFQYSNQMFAIGGYAAAVASGEPGDLYDAYARAMREQVLDPLGMARSTFAFDEVEASGDYAGSHSHDLSGAYQPVALDDEESFVRAVAPAGGLWSSAAEMARYVQMQLAHGVAPDGTPVVSRENLDATWQQQVAIPASLPTDGDEAMPAALLTMAQGYALGWLTGDYDGQRLLTHSGGTFGFSAQVALLPDADFGLVILTNGVAADYFTLAVQFRAFELLFGQPATMDAAATAGIDAVAEQFATIQGVLGSVDPVSVAPYLGAYTSDSLGNVTIALQDETLMLDVGEFRSELRPVLDQTGEVAAFLMSDPPLAGQVAVVFSLADGVPGMAVIEPSTGEQYAFTFSGEISSATPSP